MNQIEIDKKKKAVEFAGGLILFIGSICTLSFIITIISAQEEYMPLLIPLFVGAIIYTPLGYYALYKKNRWVIFSVLILLFISFISSIFNGNGGVLILLILIPVYKGTQAAFELHAYSKNII
tara:strand:+ start:2059 stop:2424 length:366 start_codon:yes stop_codon:yes gene_type:complete